MMESKHPSTSWQGTSTTATTSTTTTATAAATSNSYKWEGSRGMSNIGGSVGGNATTFLGFDISTDIDDDEKKKKWLPHLPTRAQVNQLNLFDLQHACRDRQLEVKSTDDKSLLTKRLLQWTSQQHQQRVLQRRRDSTTTTVTTTDADTAASNTADNQTPKYKNNYAFVSSSTHKKSTNGVRSSNSNSIEPSSSSTSSVDLNNMEATVKPLIHRRQELMAAKMKPKKKKTASPSESNGNDNRSPQEYLSDLSRTFAAPPSLYSNYQVQQIYSEAKIADQNGQLDKAITLLQLLKTATPHDMRVPRRLSRLYIAKGQTKVARSILEDALKQSPQNPYLLHGLATLQIKYYSNYEVAKQLYQKAISADPYMPNAHHALGTLEHSNGNIKAATEILRNGIQHCPDNHRLHHAMGDLYRDANMHRHAIQSYKKGIHICDQQKKYYGQSFLHTATSYVMYDLGHLQACKSHLKSSIRINPLHAQGWLAYAHLHQSEGDISQARHIFEQGTNTFVAKRMKSQKQHQWLQVYLSWAAMEEIHGQTYHTANNIYSQAASKAFPDNTTDKYNILMAWAQFQWRHHYYDRAKHLFQLAADSMNATSSHALPIRLQGQLEMMSLENYDSARTILFNGAKKLCASTTGSSTAILADAEEALELSKLYHLWAVCEWHLNNLERAEVLLDHAMRLVPANDDYPKNKHMRVALLYTLAKFMHDARDDHILAQHCICLALSQDVKLPHLWNLWKSVAQSTGNKHLVQQCQIEVNKLTKTKTMNDDLAQLYELSTFDETDPISFKLEDMLRKSPWQNKLFPKKSLQHRDDKADAATWINQIVFPSAQMKTKVGV